MRYQPAARCLALAQHLRNPFLRQTQSFSTSFNNLMMVAANGSSSPDEGVTLAALPKSWHLTSSLPADKLFPTPADSHSTPRDQIGPRQVRGAAFTWVRPEKQKDPELLAVSPAAMRDIGLKLSEAETDDFRETVVGNKIHGWDEETNSGPGYPWAQCYGGFQFGDWAGQLGDGRAISLFESTNPKTGHRYEVQLKGAGMTPYSRFADGKAVLRSSIREFVVSEHLHALGIPTTRALALSLLPHSKVRRERIEPGAIVVRFAESWIRFGNFDLLRARGDRDLIRKLANYIAEDVFPGWESLPGRVEDPKSEESCLNPPRGVGKDTLEGPEGEEQNRFARLYREIVRRNALTVAKWQAYGFMNGVLNTDNTSICGLSMDYGPFAFMDNFDPKYTPNHDDHFLRYSYRNQPTIIWWNLVRLGEALGELLGAGPDVDEDMFVHQGVKEETAEGLVNRAEKLINLAGEEYKSVFLAEYKRLMAARLGLKNFRKEDFDGVFSPLLDTMEALELDFNLFFRRLSTVKVGELATEEDRVKVAAKFLHKDEVDEKDVSGKEKLAEWLATWRERAVGDWGETAEADVEREREMKKVNPKFVARGWILDEIIKRVEKEGERDVLRRVIHLATHPFEESWDGEAGYEGDKEEEVRWTGDVPRQGRSLQCSCSS
ncbi:hypothetical protein QBC35DRAFT_86516 [Podospora australis]|uniref:Selenoprotein O n=1 Tax=Podospora australis TaxID=1536484 RepID=A0AAN7ALX1_9PEZI|nr:hypothetical protein QBC35DRAFT_86516 [Podospora australis]